MYKLHAHCQVPTDNILVYPNNESPIAHAALSSLRSQFPNHVITNHLIFNYFVHSSVHWLYPIISKMEFDEAYHMFSSASSLDFVSLLALVCSISMQFMSQTSNEVGDGYSFLNFGFWITDTGANNRRLSLRNINLESRFYNSAFTSLQRLLY